MQFQSSLDSSRPTTHHLDLESQPHILEVSQTLRDELPAIKAELGQLQGDLADVSVQNELRSILMANPVWNEWISAAPSPKGLRPVLVRAGLGLEKDDYMARVMLVGLALTLEPDNFTPPYAVDNLAVTEVMAKAGSTKESHSQNDLPAPPHCAGFFEPVPPHTCYFSCIRPHPGGGAETTVVNLERILSMAPSALIEEWANKDYYLRTSKRLGEEVRPFKLLSWVDGLPFLRYRKEYTQNFEQDRSLTLLEELIRDPKNQFIVPLKAGETLVHWNGSPHSRTAQNGPTPDDPTISRKLIRCRSEPTSGWRELFGVQ